MKKAFLSILCLVTLFSWPVTAQSIKGFEAISAKQLKKIIDSKQKVFLLNPLSEVAFDQGFIPGSVNIHFAQIQKNKHLLPKNKKALIISYCLGPK